MTTKILIRHAGGNKSVGVFNEGTGSQDATLAREGDEATFDVYDGQQFSVREIGEFDDLSAVAAVGPTPRAPYPEGGDPVADTQADANAAHNPGRKLPGER